LRQKSCEFLIVEYFQIATWGYFAYRRRMPSVPLIAIWRLDKNARVAQALGENFPTYVVQSYTFSYVPSSLLYDCVAIYVGQQP
jgi:hypothetical protein